MELVHDIALAPALERTRSSRLFVLAFAVSFGLHLAVAAAFIYRTPSHGVAQGAPEAISVSIVSSAVFDAVEETAPVHDEAAASAPVDGAKTGASQAKTDSDESPRKETVRRTPPTDPAPSESESGVSPLPPVLATHDETLGAAPKPARVTPEKRRASFPPEDKRTRRHAKHPPRQRQAAASGRGADAASGRVSASRGSLADYASVVRARLARHKPDGLAAAGTAKVAFAISAGGGLVYTRLARSSGSAVLDAAAVRAVRAAAPFPPPPGGRTFSTIIPFESR